METIKIYTGVEGEDGWQSLVLEYRGLFIERLCWDELIGCIAKIALLKSPSLFKGNPQFKPLNIKRTIEIEETSEGWVVREGDRFALLTWCEMLGQIATMTHPMMDGRPFFAMSTYEDQVKTWPRTYGKVIGLIAGK